ncbi:MAG: HAMP domain-containing histidine kinase [Lachnospiraceae bacterium]|nr:HAMP domain-containing histidine kinase [Lachnospiraceae bacterium]
MYKKVHLQLTLLFTGIAAAIMIIMSLCYLYVSESGLYRNQYNSFKNDMNTIATNLEQMSVISMQWLSKMEAQGSYTFFVLDNGAPFLYNQLTKAADSQKYVIMEECLDAYYNTFSFSEAGVIASPFLSYHVEYQFISPSTKEKYFGSVISIEKGNSLLQIIVFSPMKFLEKQISGQRYRFILIDLTAILLLAVFSWFFTGKLLHPILESQQRQARFISSASHELRTPLAIIMSSLDCCQNSKTENPQRFLKTIRQESVRMSSLINDMLVLSESDQHLPVRKKPVELDTLLINSYEAFEYLAKEKEIALSVNLPEDMLPPCSCDPDRISQVISILIHNAISYTPKMGKIDLSLSYDKKCFFLSVKDNGIGISDEDKKKIFDRFYRAEKARNTKGHFGLGLSIAYEIAASHNGSISVKDAFPKGTEFVVVLPEE